MSSLEIIQVKGPNDLRETCKEVPNIDRLIKQMIATLHITKAVGIAAPQVGRNLRLFVTNCYGTSEAYINPVLTFRSEEMELGEEGCLSLPGIFRQVPRHVTIEIEYTDKFKRFCRKKISGFEARVIQHEIDHLDGILITDYILHE